jgi:hypothetical protein
MYFSSLVFDQSQIMVDFVIFSVWVEQDGQLQTIYPVWKLQMRIM